jgi:hypothetical protein
LTDGNGVARLQNARFAATECPSVKDRRKELRPNTRLQLLSVSGRLSGLSAADLEKALTMLYVSQPLRWQTFMDEAQIVIDAAGEYDSGFAETVQPADG